MSVAFPDGGHVVVAETYIYSIYAPSGWRYDRTVELVEDTDGGRFYSHANITGEPVPWDMEYDRKHAMDKALAAMRYDGFHL